MVLDHDGNTHFYVDKPTLVIFYKIILLSKFRLMFDLLQKHEYKLVINYFIMNQKLGIVIH
jgi:hypothetical protein